MLGFSLSSRLNLFVNLESSRLIHGSMGYFKLTDWTGTYSPGTLSSRNGRSSDALAIPYIIARLHTRPTAAVVLAS